MRILLIDDSAPYLEEFADLLTAGPFADASVDRIGDAEAGLRAMNQGAHDIYFVDYRLPGDSGIELVERARGAGIDAPIIFLTGFGNAALDQAAERAGANDYLLKGGFTAEMLGRAIRYALRNAGAVRIAREAENRFRLAQEAANIGTWDWDLRAGALVCSPRQRAMFGLAPADRAPITAESWRAAIHPEDRDAADAAIAAGIAAMAPFETLFRVIQPDAPGSPIRWLAGKAMVFPDAAGRPARVLGVHVDVTDQQNALADMRASRNAAVAHLYQSENRFQTYFESVPDWLFHVRPAPDRRFVFETINPAALARSGMTAEAAKGRTPEDVLGHEIGQAVTAALSKTLDEGAPVRHEVSVASATGQMIFDCLYMPLRERDGAINGVLGCARDISDRRRLEDTLRHSQKMEVLGQISSGVAHDFNNILQSISGCLELVLAEATPGTQSREMLELGLRAAKRGADLTHHLLAYARKQLLRPRSVALPALLRDIEMLLAHTLGTSIAVRIQVDPPLPDVHADPVELQTALLNLAINGAHAMPAGGVLAVSAREVVEDGKSWVVIAVTDTGTGMDEATRARATEPFFTTKGVSGAGLGLSMVQGFIAQSGGKFAIRSRSGEGTTVELHLPAIATGSKAEAALSRPEKPGGRAILLVDDDPDVLVTLGLFLEKAGFKVVRAANGGDALAILGNGMPVDAIVSDFAMPRMNGADMIARARAMRPDLPAVLISGYVAAAESMPPIEAVVTLDKPFQRRALIDTLERLLAGTRATREPVRSVQPVTHVPEQL